MDNKKTNSTNHVDVYHDNPENVDKMRELDNIRDELEYMIAMIDCGSLSRTQLKLFKVKAEELEAQLELVMDSLLDIDDEELPFS